MKKLRACLLVLVLILSVSGEVAAGSLEVYFGPGGGFNPENRSRRIAFPDGTLASPTLALGVQELIARTEPGGQVKICTYSMSDYDTLEKIFLAAREKDITVKLLFDAAAEWTASSRDKILELAKKARGEAAKQGQKFDVQIKVVTAKSMRDRGRERRLDDGKMIVGTMHEKFGVIYRKGRPVPLDGFTGSSNLSFTSDQIYAENRVFFRDCPALARQFQEEFARLWNEYGTPILGPCSPETFIPVSPMAGEVEVYFNAEPIDETALTRLDHVLLRTIDQVKPQGSLDVAMFSLTNPEMAQALIRCAQRNPGASFRILLDQSQVDDIDPEESIQGPWLERESARWGLKNFQVRYKWRSNAIGFDKEAGKIQYVSLKGLFLHHKFMIVNGDTLGMGSYNWSSSGEFLNFEDILLFRSVYPDQGNVVAAFAREFDTIWSGPGPRIPAPGPLRDGPQTVSGPEGRALEKKIATLLADEDCRKILNAMDRGALKTTQDLTKVVSLSPRALERKLQALYRLGLICESEKGKTKGWVQAD